MAVLYFVLVVKLKLGSGTLILQAIQRMNGLIQMGKWRDLGKNKKREIKRASLMGREGHWEILQRCEVEAKRKGDEQK